MTELHARHPEFLTFWKKYRKGNDKITRHAERSEASPLFWGILHPSHNTAVQAVPRITIDGLQ